jgi:hypothetical protein
MPCFYPLTAWYSKEVNPSGRRSMVFNNKYALQPDDPINLPCGRCVGCRLERSKQWAIRCYHEASMYDNNCFITLTFAPEHLENRCNPWSVDVRDFQLFMKRLRKKFVPKNPYCSETQKELYDRFREENAIRFFHCGEYGDLNRRPHYHACLFNFDFEDKELWKITDAGSRLYISDTLSELWPYGFSTIGDVTFESAAYVARYIMKKITGDAAEEHYLNKETGEILSPEYITMSRNPGIASKWLEEYMDDVYPHDYVVVNGVKCKPPKFYDSRLQLSRPYEFDEIKDRREINYKTCQKSVDNNTRERLNVRETCTLARLKKLERNL